MLRCELESFDRRVGVGESLEFEVVGDTVDLLSPCFELAEVEGGCGVGDDIEAGRGGERELFGVAAGQRRDEVLFGVVDVLGG